MEEDKKLILELCKRNGIVLHEEAVEGEYDVVATESTIKRVPKGYQLKEGEVFVTPETAGELLTRPIDLSLSQQEIQKAINEQHYELTEEDINAVKNN